MEIKFRGIIKKVASENSPKFTKYSSDHLYITAH